MIDILSHIMICSRFSSQLLFDLALRLFPPQISMPDLLTQSSAHSSRILIRILASLSLS